MSRVSRKSQQRQPVIYNYIPDPEDYVKEYEAFHICEIQGKRGEQQDAIAISYVKEFADCSVAQRIGVLRYTLKRMQDIYNAHTNEIPFGAVLSVPIAWIDKNSVLHIWVANVGDSGVYVTIFDDEKRSSSTYRLTYPHVLDPKENQAEHDRVREATNHKQPQQDSERTYRLDPKNRGLMPSRSLGDNDAECYGLIHEPEIFEYRFQLTAKQLAKVTVACDGLEEGLSVSEINQCLYDSDAQNTNSAEALVAASYQKDSGDNISVVVFTPGTEPTSALVVDGHGGDKQDNTALFFAQTIANGFYWCLSGNIAAIKSSVLNEVVADYATEVCTQYLAFLSESTTFSEIDKKTGNFFSNLQKRDNAICLEVEAGFYRGGDAIKDTCQLIEEKILSINRALSTFKENNMQELKDIIDDQNGAIKAAQKLITDMPSSSKHDELDAQYCAVLKNFFDPEKIFPSLPIRLVMNEDGGVNITLINDLTLWIKEEIAKLLSKYYGEIKSKWHFFGCKHAKLFKDKLAISSHFSIVEEGYSVLPKNQG